MSANRKAIRKAIIPAAGLGTRFLPATKSIPKELLPIVDEPILLRVVKEAVDAGIEDIIIIAGRGKSAIEDFFDRSYELESTLREKQKSELLKTLLEVQSLVNIISVRQKEAKGLGHAISMGRSIVGNEPFAVLLGDEIMVQADAKQPNVIKQLASTYQSTGISTVAVMEVSKEDISKYGIVEHKSFDKMPMTVTDVVEKPSPEKAPSSWALPGRYIFSPDIFKYLQNLSPGKGGEIQLTDAMTLLANNEGLQAQSFDGQRFDAGDKFGFLQANIELVLRHPEIGPKLRQFLKDRCANL